MKEFILSLLESTVVISEPQPIPEPQRLVVRGILTVFFFLIFLFWHRKQARMFFQAWALFATTLNLALFLNAFPNFEFLSGANRLFLQVLLALNSTIAVYKSWLISEKYMPKTRMIKMKNNNNFSKHKMAAKSIIVRLLAFTTSFNEGGNGDHKLKKIKNNIANRVSI